MSSLAEKVVKAECKDGDVVIDGSNPFSEPYMVTRGGLVPLLNLPFTIKGKSADSISLQLPGYTAERINVNDVTWNQVKVSNSIIVDSEGTMTWYKLYDWSGSEWIAWEAKKIKILS